MIIEIILFFLVIILLGIILYGRSNYGILENSGFPVLKPSLFLGSVPDMHKKVAHIEDYKRFKKFGPIWGVYEGKSPQVFICDPELIRLIFVKDYDYFHNRRDMDFGSEIFNEILDYLPGEKWKTVRSMLSPIFTTSKLKAMCKSIVESTQDFCNQLKNECKNGSLKFDTKLRTSAMLIDMFARTTFGVSMDDAANPRNKFAEAFRDLMGEEQEFNFLYSWTMTFSILGFLTPQTDQASRKLIKETFLSILNSRKGSQSTNDTDLVDFLNKMRSKLDSEDFKRLNITEMTIISQAVNLFLGGYETSSSTSSSLLYYLAKDPEIQERVYSEVKKCMEKFRGRVDHDTIKDEDLPFLNACINEAIRLCPSLIRPERLCMKDWSYKGYSIKKGTAVFIASWPANRNPDVYSDPELFNPERFLPENKGNLNPYAFTSFGFGPRNCMGMRFAYDSLKILFVHLIANFQFTMRNDTEINYKPGSHLIHGFKSPLFLDLKLR